MNHLLDPTDQLNRMLSRLLAVPPARRHGRAVPENRPIAKADILRRLDKAPLLRESRLMNVKHLIRPATEADSYEAAGLLQQLADEHTLGNPATRPPGRQVTLEERAERVRNILAQPNGGVLVCTDAGLIMGLVIVHLQQAKGAAKPGLGIATVSRLVVSSDARRSGIGRALVEAAQQWAAARGVRRLGVNVADGNDVAIRFYEALGYRTKHRFLALSLVSAHSSEDDGLAD
jgi:ribosomal protein S18 acetylase RimI-like enzyme